MLKPIYFILAVGVLLPIMGSGRARADQLVALDEVRPLVEWVETRTNLMLLPRPRVFVSDAALDRLGRMPGDLNVEGRNGAPIAAYRNRAIFIGSRYWDSGDKADRSVVVHELVHYAQDVGGQRYGCAGQREAEAYRLQNEWLLENGERPYMDADALVRLASCR